MAENLYEILASKNAQLAKFFDECHEAAKMVKKLIGLIARIANENHTMADEITYDVFCPKGGDVIIVRLRHKTKTLTV